MVKYTQLETVLAEFFLFSRIPFGTSPNRTLFSKSSIAVSQSFVINNFTYNNTSSVTKKVTIIFSNTNYISRDSSFSATFDKI